VTEARPQRGGAIALARSPLTSGRNELSDYLHVADRLLLVGSYAGATVGLAVLEVEPLVGLRPLGRLELLFVEPAARRVGVGDALFEQVLVWCEERGCGGIDAAVLPGDLPAKAFFESWGLTARALTLHRRCDEGR